MIYLIFSLIFAVIAGVIFYFKLDAGGWTAVGVLVVILLCVAIFPFVDMLIPQEYCEVDRQEYIAPQSIVFDEKSENIYITYDGGLVLRLRNSTRDNKIIKADSEVVTVVTYFTRPVKPNWFTDFGKYETFSSRSKNEIYIPKDLPINYIYSGR